MNSNRLVRVCLLVALMAIAALVFVGCQAGIATPTRIPGPTATKQPVSTATVAASPTPVISIAVPSSTAAPATVQPSPTTAVLPSPTPAKTVISYPTQTPEPVAPDETPVSGEIPELDAARLALIDNHALAAPVSAEASVDALAEYLNGPARDDFERGRVIFRWITNNITYDFPAFEKKVYPDQSAEAVLARKTGVCAGYANLFEALGTAMGLETVVVSGWAKGYSYAPTTLMGDTNHAWNAVNIDGDWYLVESTWGAGGIDEDKTFQKEFNGYYFLVPPEELIYTHFPEDPKWQLLKKPISAETFHLMPNVRPLYFEHQIKLVSNPLGVLETTGEVRVTLSAPSYVELSASVKKDGVELDDKYTFVQRNGGLYEISAAFPQAGEYALAIYTKRADVEGDYHSTVEYQVNVSGGIPDHPGWPQVWQPFFDNEIGLVSHPGGTIDTTGEVIVMLTAPEDVELTARVEQDGIKLDRKYTFIQREGNIFEVSAAFPQAGEYALAIYTKRASEEGDYHGTLEYVVRVVGGIPDHPGWPQVWQSYHDNAIGLVSHQYGTIDTEGDVLIRISAPDDVLLIAGISSQGTQLPDDYVTVQKQAGLYEIAASFPGPGEYLLIIYTKKTGDAGDLYTSTVAYTVQVKE